MYRSLIGTCRIFGASILLVSMSVFADVESVEKAANTVFKAFTKNKQIDSPLTVAPDHALATQNYYIALLRPTWGLDVGYAASVSQSGSPGVTLTGILLENMFTGTRAIMNRSYGVNMKAAGELMFRVKSEAINTASSRLEALAALKSVIPTVRLTDGLLANGEKPNDSVLLAANLCVRFCVLGGEVLLSDDPAWVERLGSVSLRMYDENKKEVASFDHSKHTLHPLDAVLAMRDALAFRGVTIKENELLAVGTLTQSYDVVDLSRLSAVFTGLVPDESSLIYMGFQ